MGFHDDFFVGERGERGGTPIHHAFAAIDESLFVKLDEHLLHAARIGLVHREPFACPVTRRADLFQLLDDDAAVFFLPLPDTFEEFFAAQIVAMPDFTGFFQRSLDDGLRGDTGVVGAGQPEDFPAVHARLATENVLNGVVEDMPHREHAGDIRWRDDDRISGPFGGNARGIGGEATLLHPKIVPFVLNGLRFVCFWNFGHT